MQIEGKMPVGISRRSASNRVIFCIHRFVFRLQFSHIRQFLPLFCPKAVGHQCMIFLCANIAAFVGWSQQGRLHWIKQFIPTSFWTEACWGWGGNKPPRDKLSDWFPAKLFCHQKRQIWGGVQQVPWSNKNNRGDRNLIFFLQTNSEICCNQTRNL